MVLTNSRKNVLECLALDSGVDLGGAQGAIESKEVSDEASDMRGGHGSSGELLGRSVIESRDDIEARSPDVDARTEVREGSLGIGDGGGGDGDGLLDASGGFIDNVLVVVSCSDDNSDAGVKELVRGIRVGERLDVSHEAYLDDGVVEGLRGATSKT